ncbi:MAG TPA: PQQ-binding-like beta-propeller repeat protein [Rhodanobacter sp.]|nr:PQQ-binding-like beta-propeller repeat protein [Rhodanobacter sp.]
MRFSIFGAFKVCTLLAIGIWSTDIFAAPMGPTQSELDHAADGKDTWLMTNKSYDGQRYVALDQINTRNVAGLKEVCTLDTGVQEPAQSSPLLYDGRIYFTAGASTIAMDAKTCKELWRYDWQLKGKMLSSVNRGLAMKDGRLVRGTPDGFLIALSMADGKLVWSRQITSYDESHYLSMPAMIVDNTIIYGTAGADWGGQGWIGAFRLQDGTELWRYAVLPKPNSEAAKTWGSPEALAHGGGSFWTPVSVDRAKNIVFIPTGNPAPDFYGEVRQGDNLGTNSAIALDLKSGKVIWAKQFVAHDTHDWDLTQTGPLLHANVKGKMRNIIMVSGKDGRLRAVDRDSGEILYDIPISKQENADKATTATPTHVCPGLLGGQEWSSTAYDPKRGITISPMVDWCGMASHITTPPVHKVGEHYYAGKIEQDPIDQAKGVLAAVDVASGKLRWKVEGAGPMLANVTATSGDVVFAGDLKGTLYAVDADNGNVLLRRPLPASAGGGIFTYALDNKQYLTVMSGSVSGFFGGGHEPVKLTVLALP